MLVLEYYWVLRRILRKRPELWRLLVRCRHCRIFFFTHPRNCGRADLGCPFGCRVEHQRRESARRSAEYYTGAVGKLKKKFHNAKRGQAKDQSSEEEAPSRDGSVSAAASPSTPEPASASAGSAERAAASAEDVGADATAEMPAPAAASASAPEPAPQSSDSAEAAASAEDAGVRRRAEKLEVNETVAKLRDGPGEKKASAQPIKAKEWADSEPPRKQPGEAPEAENGPAAVEARADTVPAGESDESSESAEGDEFDEGILEHVQLLAALIDGENLSPEETIELLRRVMRQRSIAKGSALDYVLDQLKKKPP